MAQTVLAVPEEDLPDGDIPGAQRECMHPVCVWGRALRWTSIQSHFEGATISGLARQLGTTWNAEWSRIKPVLQATPNESTHYRGVKFLDLDKHA